MNHDDVAVWGFHGELLVVRQLVERGLIQDLAGLHALPRGVEGGLVVDLEPQGAAVAPRELWTAEFAV